MMDGNDESDGMYDILMTKPNSNLKNLTTFIVL